VSRPAATVSVDVDPIDLHLLGYGVPGGAPDRLVYDVALPRLRERLAHAGVRGTFFVVARDADVAAAPLRDLVAVGHEVASHSLTHPLALSRMPDASLDAEAGESRRRLERATGAEVVGFRAPNFDLDARVANALVRAGYRYDASGYPSPWLLPARIRMAIGGAGLGALLGMRAWPTSLRREPHDYQGLREFPLSVTPGTRMPIYHTLGFFTARDRFLEQIGSFAARGEPLSYILHAVDALGAAEDRVEPRLGRHPGMDRSREDKLAWLDQVLARIARHYDVRPFRDRLGDGAGRTRPGGVGEESAPGGVSRSDSHLEAS